MYCAIRPSLAIFLLLAATAAASAQPAVNALEPARGKVLLLDNDRVLEGDIEKVGDQYRIRRSIGELWVNADRGKRLCKDLDEAYDLVRRQMNLKDADERLRLARWCQMNGLKTHALNEAKLALDMRPEHLETLRFVQLLQRAEILPATQQTTSVPQPALKATPRPPLDVSTESFAVFATRVQPILMNTCVTCHSHGKGGAFQLVRVGDGGARASAQANMNAALEFVNVEKSSLSPLLIKSVVAHGGANASPLKGRQSPPFLTLQNWVDDTLTNNPHIKELRHAEGPNAATPFGGSPFKASTSAKKDYVPEPFAEKQLPPQTMPAQSLAPAPTIPIDAVPPAPTTPPRTLPAMPSQKPLQPPRELSFDLKKGEEVSRPTPRYDDVRRPLPAATPTPLAGPRDPFDPAEFNARPK